MKPSASTGGECAIGTVWSRMWLRLSSPLNATGTDKDVLDVPEAAMPQTHMLNPNPKKCSAYHEAGHAVVGIIGGLKLKTVTVRVTDNFDPHCRWDEDYINPILKSESLEPREDFTELFAEMCLASRYSEMLSCDISSDEQRDSHRFDWLDLQNIARAALSEFSLETVEQLNRRARTLVNQYAAAIRAVADRLLVCGTLDQTEVESIIKDNPVNARV